MDFGNHPCFSAEARHSTARIHLPIAPKCNVQCNFCNRKYDCVNESRPGVCSTVLSPDQADRYLDSVLEKVKNIAVVGIAGPGDPFANPEETIKTLELVHAKHPELLLCLATNGLGLPEYVDRIARLNISHVTITLNAIDPEIGAKIYSWVRFGPHTYRGIEGARLLLERQTESIKRLKAANIAVKINTVIIPGVNAEHASAIAKFAADLGADVQNCIPLMHVEDTVFAGKATPDAVAMQALRFETGKYLRQMSHCARCRADAVGLVGQTNSPEIEKLLSSAAKVSPVGNRRLVAVASREGLFVNQHLGEATGLWLFGLVDGKVSLVGIRPTPVPGGGDSRWQALASLLPDCFAILASGSGISPGKVLAESGIKVIAMEGLIQDGVVPLLGGQDVPRILLRTAGSCGFGTSCGGTGMGCA